MRAYTYIRMLGAAGLRQASENAVLNANYLQSAGSRTSIPSAHDRTCMHEFVAAGHRPGAPDVHALDIAKRLIDYGFHPPTNYFPLIVPEALMIEPTETESKETLDAFADALQAIARGGPDQPGAAARGAAHRARAPPGRGAGGAAADPALQELMTDLAGFLKNLSGLSLWGGPDGLSQLWRL